MSNVLRNLSANFIGQVWVAVIGIVFVPVYLKFIGVEGYGLIGFFTLLASAMAVFDGGLGAVATRESSLYEVAVDRVRLSTVLTLRSIELLFWMISLVVGIVIFFISPLIVSHWLVVDADKVPVMTGSLRLMCGALVIQFSLAFYTGCFVGLQKQVHLNKINILFSTVRSVGAALVLAFVSPSIDAFFIWQAFISFVTLLVMRSCFLCYIDEWHDVSWFSYHKIVDIWSFTASVGVTNILAFLLIQADKILLSKLLSLKDFGYYMLAWTVGSVAFRLITPVFNAYYPRIAILVEKKDFGGCYDVYIKSCRILSTVVVPLSLWLALFSKEILFSWTGSVAISDSASMALSTIAVGTMFHSFLHMPYSLQLAHAWTKLSVWQNSLALLIILPLTYFLTSQYGLAAGGWPWLVVNFMFVLVCVPIILNKFSIRPMSSWYLEAIGFPMVISLFPLLCFKALIVFINNQSFVVVSVALAASYLFVAARILFLAIRRGGGWKNIL